MTDEKKTYNVGDVLYKKGDFEVVLIKYGESLRKYRLHNVATDVWEHESTMLYEVMRMAVMFDAGIKDILDPPDWSKKATQPNIVQQLDLFDLN